MSSGSILPLIVSFLVVAFTGPFIIPMLKKLKFGQNIRNEGPKSHLAKNGTPTMGGVMILLGIIIATAFFSDFSTSVLIALFLTLAHAMIGFCDDYIKIVKKRSLGLTAFQKLFLQFLIAAIYLAYITFNNTIDKSVFIPATHISFELGWVYYIFAFLLLLGATNAVNLTDGLDGLASSVTVPVMFIYSVIAYWSGDLSLAYFGVSVVGSCLGFLLFNKYPAKVFMGDTGSLALGGAVAAMALLTKTELLLVIIGGVYVLEALSVILQVGSFKLRNGKRIFKMSPIHHHFELSGWKETKVVFVFTFLSLGLSMLGLILFFMGFSIKF